MRLVFLTHQYFPKHIGGTEVFTRDLVRRAVDEGHEALVISCLESEETFNSQVQVKRNSYESVPLLELHFNLSTFPCVAEAEYNNEVIAQVLREELTNYKPQLAHITHAMKLSCAALDVCHALGIPTVVTLSDFWFICPRTNLLTWDGLTCAGPKWFNKCLQCVGDLHNIDFNFANTLAVFRRKGRLKQSLLKADRIIALTNFQKNVFVNNGFPSHRIEVMEHGVEASDLAVSGNENGTASSATHGLTVGFIGSLVPHKAPHILAEALKELPNLPLECHIYGAVREGDGYCRSLKKAASEDKRFLLKGTFSPSNLGQVLGTFDILAMPAIWYENGPLVVKAALMSGIPVLASNIGSLPDMVNEGINGWLVKPGSAQDWAKAISEIASKPLPEFTPPKIKTFADNATELFAIYEVLRTKCPV